jgi:site-specific DNA-methyltransferase (adenine-specific)
MDRLDQYYTNPRIAAEFLNDDCLAANDLLRSIPASDTTRLLRGDYLLRLGDALALIRSLPANSIDLLATDPPYFIDGMGSEWNRTTLNDKAAKGGVVRGLPVGMKFDKSQGRRLQAFMSAISTEAYRVLKPGAFFLSFSQARLYHRLAVAIDDAGFEIRDMLAWKYEGQAKAFSLAHFVRKQGLSQAEAARILRLLDGRKTPQLKPQMEPICLGQKPREGTFLENWLKHETGLVDITASLDGKFPGTVMEVRKPDAKEKGDACEHLTVKPVVLMSHLLNLFSKPGQVVLDPFSGSGTTGLAAVATGRRYIGFEIDRHYFDISERRLRDALDSR